VIRSRSISRGFELKSGFIENYRSLFFGIEINKIEALLEFFDEPRF
jgi:hypothetical protein